MSIYRTPIWIVKGLREFTKSGYESASKSFDPHDLDNGNILNRSFMVTGANSGLGKVAALTIAKKGGTVHMICRNEERGQAALKELKEASGNENIHLHLVDMSKPREIKTFVQQFIVDGRPLNVLINNAGVLLPDGERQVTDDGLETTFATNSLGTHVLTKGLLPVLESAVDPRVITVSSGGMLLQKLDVNDVQFEKMRRFDGTIAYSQTKRQQVIMTEEYSAAHPKVHFSCMHPGWADTPGVQTSIPDFHEKFKNKLRSDEQGADTMVWLAVSNSVKKHPSGLFFLDRTPAPTHLPLAWTKASKGDRQKLMDILEECSKRFL